MGSNWETKPGRDLRGENVFTPLAEGPTTNSASANGVASAVVVAGSDGLM